MDPKLSKTGTAPTLAGAPPYREFVEGTDDLVLQLDPSGRILFINQSSQRLLGASPDDCVGQSFLSYVHPDDHGRAEKAFKEWMRDDVSSVSLETRLLSRTGEVSRIAWMISLRQESDGSVSSLNGIGRDVTERKELEAQLRHSQKMESVGRLAGGIAHDLNNVFSSILGYCELALLQTDRDDGARSHLQHIAEAGKKAASLTDQLLVFSRKRDMNMGHIDLNRTVRNLLKMLDRMIGDDVRLTFDSASKKATIRGDAGQIEQVIMNLAVNARDAMREGGQLSIRTDPVQLEADEGSGSMAAGEYVRLLVSDTGEGLSPEVQERMFEPFFTTKPEGMGTGLGLSTVYGIVQQHAAGIFCESALGAGTTFSVFFPADPGEADEEPVVAEEPELHPGVATILVVDDETAILHLVRDSLTPAGYRILTALSGEAAIDICEREKGAVDVLLTDVIMPDMSGWELAEVFRSHRPDTRIVFMSGYFGRSPGGRKLPEYTAGFLQKPLTPSQLAGALRQVLSDGELPAEP